MTDKQNNTNSTEPVEQKEFRRTHKPWEHNESKLHHRHAPTLSKVTHGFFWKLAHLYWPIFVHFMTDKYHGRLHHLIVDIIYAVISLTLLFANIGLAIWFYLYFSPADIQVRAQAPSVVRSGQDMLIAADYVVGGRDIDNVRIEYILPEGFLADSESTVLEKELGDLDEGAVGQTFVRGQVYGSVGSTYNALVVVRYESYGREYSQVTRIEFTVNIASFEMEIELPDTVTYNVPVIATARYFNKSDVDRTNVRMLLQIPSNFQVDAVRAGDTSLFYNQATGEVFLPDVPAGEKGELQIQGRFIRARGELVGDMHQQFSVAAITILETAVGAISEEYQTEQSQTAFNVVVPRVTVFATAPESVQFGDTLTGSVVLRNVGDEAVSDVSIVLDVVGTPVVAANMRLVQVGDERVYITPQTQGTKAIFNAAVSALAPGEERTVVYSLPTAIVDGQQVSSQITAFGSAYVPVVDARIPIVGNTAETKYNSRVSLDARAVYYGPNGEQLGFGPYPARAWEETGMRLLLRVTNPNNPLSNVRLTATLPGQIEWTDLYSVSAGTSMTYNPLNSTVTWIMPTLQPSDTGYGAQFEVILYPNHLQVGLQPHMLDSIQITATDAYTGSSIYQSEGAIQIPQPIRE